MSDTKYFEDAREMFMTQGWRDFILQIEDNLANINLDSVNDTNGFWVAKGQLSVLRLVAGYEDSIRAAEDMEEEDNASYL